MPRHNAQVRLLRTHIDILRVRIPANGIDYILRTWVRHYNTERPHRGSDIGNNVLQIDFRPARDGPVCRKSQLDGIITTYTCEAA